MAIDIIFEIEDEGLKPRGPLINSMVALRESGQAGLLTCRSAILE